MAIIAFACKYFEEAASYLGRNLSNGIKGATINAIGSSFPELMTATIALVFYQDKAGFAFGVGTTAGSAIFNSAIIPALVILTAAFYGKSVKVSKSTILRDGLMLILSELLLIKVLSDPILDASHGIILLGMYGVYAIILYTHNSLDKSEDNDDISTSSSTSKSTSLTIKAWFRLILTMTAIGFACHLLVDCCYSIGSDLGIPSYFVAVILAAAATSVPDTILSMIDATKGEYDDAVSNALGSNIFDICFCIGFPLATYCLFTGETITINESASSIAELRVLLLIFTIIIFLLLLIGRRVGYVKGLIMFYLYGFFVAYIIGRAYENEIALNVSHHLQEILKCFH